MRLRESLSIAILMGALAAQSFGAVEYWDVNGSVTGAGGVNGAPAGTWDTSGGINNWNLSSTGTGSQVAWTAGSDAVFAAGTNATGSYNVSLLGNPSLASLTVEEGSPTIVSGGSGSTTLDFGSVSAAPINIGSGATLTENASTVFAGTGGLVKTGTGTLFLRGTNTFTKSGTGSQAYLTISNGIVDFTSDANLGAALPSFDAAALTMNGGTLQYIGGGDFQIPSNRGITIGANGGTFRTNARLTLPAVVGAGTIATSSFGRVIMQNAPSSFSGKYAVNAGTLQATDDSNFGVLSSSPSADYFTLNGGILRMDSSTAVRTINANRGITLGAGGGGLIGPIYGFTYDGIISGTAGGKLSIKLSDAITDNNTGGLVALRGASTYDGPTELLGGTLQVNSLANGGISSPIGKSSAAASNLLLDYGVFQYVGTGGSTDRSFTLAPGSVTVNASGVNNAAIAFTSNASIVMAGTGSHGLNLEGTSTGDNVMGLAIGDQGTNKTTVFKQGTGTWVLTNTANSYTNNTAVNEGRLKLGASGVIPDASIITIFSTGGVFDLNGFDETVKSIEGGSGSVALGSNTLTFANPNGETYSNPITGAGGRIIKAGSGKLTLSGTNTYTGDTVVQNGDLSISKAYLAIGSDVRLSTGSTFELNFAGNDTIHSLYIDGVSVAPGTWGGLTSTATHKSALIAGTGVLFVGTGILGDFNNSGVVDAADYIVWRNNLGTSNTLANSGGLGTPVGQAQYNLWRSHFGATAGSGSGMLDAVAVPEPTALVQIAMVVAALLFRRRN
ncbi:MAG TPA: autotransporter-associated beta strand repeat-containing protein [Lacipirellulaceae bacterium]|nr:autotransporter-associated beta strand repeat-containing protein [Lacipirellulaceae bacterium]